jgi:WD40 repeat protein
LLTFSPGGRILAAGGGDGPVRLWDVTDPAQPRPLGQAVTGAGTSVYSVAFSPGGLVIRPTAGHAGSQ